MLLSHTCVNVQVKLPVLHQVILITEERPHDYLNYVYSGYVVKVCSLKQS